MIYHEKPFISHRDLFSKTTPGDSYSNSFVFVTRPLHNLNRCIGFVDGNDNGNGGATVTQRSCYKKRKNYCIYFEFD
jgi:hypothetical protein